MKGEEGDISIKELRGIFAENRPFAKLLEVDPICQLKTEAHLVFETFRAQN
jgi:hypothetical protein